MSCPDEPVFYVQHSKFRWSALHQTDRCCSFILPSPVFLWVVQNIWPDVPSFLQSSHWLRCQSTLKRTDCCIQNALCWVCDFHKVCEVLPGCVFFCVVSVSKVWKWWLTIFVWLDILLISSQDLIVYPFHFVFLLQGASWCLWCSLMYDAILLLLNLYLYRFTYFLYLSPLFFNFPCAYCSKKSMSTQYYRWCNVDSYLFFFTLMYDLRNCKNAFTVLVCKMYV